MISWIRLVWCQEGVEEEEPTRGGNYECIDKQNAEADEPLFSGFSLHQTLSNQCFLYRPKSALFCDVSQ